ncbi:MAG TPA: hypothetical protein PK244_01980, partial [Pseudomonadales bacterium]|nr:hypothetical protein [Pseudomonadales bacterium]
MKHYQTMLHYFLQTLILLMLTGVSSLSLATTENCQTTYISNKNSTLFSTKLKTEKESLRNLLEATDTAYEHQGQACITIVNQDATTKSISIYLENTRVRHIEVLNITNSTHQLIGISGMEYPLVNWESLGSEIIFDIKIPPNTSETLRINAGSIFPYHSVVLIRDTERMLHLLTLQQSVAGLLIGFVLSLILYSLLIGL